MKRLTDAAIRATKAGTDTYDPGTTGLILRTTKAGRRNWLLAFRIDGRRTKLTLGHYPEIGLADARLAAAEVRRDLAAGINPITKAATDRNAMTVEQLLAEYEAQEAVHLRSATERMRTLRKDLHQWRRKRAKDICRRDVVLLLDVIRGRGPHAARNFQAAFGRVMSFAAERGIVEVNPIQGLRRKRDARVKARQVVLNDEEIRSFWHGLDSIDAAEATKLALKMVLASGQRPGEVVAMRWDDLFPDVWTIPAEKHKTGTGNTVPRSAVMNRILMAMPRRGDFVFANASGDGHITRHALSRLISRHRDELGLAHATPHDLRRTMRTRLTELAVDVITAELLIGHKPSAILGEVAATYDTASRMDQKAAAMKAWSAGLSRIIDGKPMIDSDSGWHRHG